MFGEEDLRLSGTRGGPVDIFSTDLWEGDDVLLLEREEHEGSL